MAGTSPTASDDGPEINRTHRLDDLTQLRRHHAYRFPDGTECVAEMYFDHDEGWRGIPYAGWYLLSPDDVFWVSLDGTITRRFDKRHCGSSNDLLDLGGALECSTCGLGYEPFCFYCHSLPEGH